MSNKIQDVEYINTLSTHTPNTIDNNNSESNTDNDSDSDSYHSDSSNNNDTVESSFCFTKNSNLYVVTVDDFPKFYVKDIKSASDSMWDLAKLLSGEAFCSGYRTSVFQNSTTEIHIIGSYRFFLFSYNKIIHSIKYSEIKECLR
jgi:hypothetical protein